MINFNEVIKKFIRTNRMHKELVDARVGSLGVHRSQHMMLLCINRFEKEPTQREISQKLEISPATVAVTVKKLESAGYIERNGDKADGRCNVIRISEKGKKLLEDTKEIFESIDSVTFAGLRDEEIDIFMKCLSKMQENISAYGEESSLSAR